MRINPPLSEQDLYSLAADVQVLLMDVDGVLTDGRLYFSPGPDGKMGPQGTQGPAGPVGAADVVEWHVDPGTWKSEGFLAPHQGGSRLRQHAADQRRDRAGRA